jgi:hypothetical protein
MFVENVAGEGLCTLRFETETTTILNDECKLCWHSLTGDTVVVSGFPIMDRCPWDKGLQIPLDVMAALGGISFASDDGSGYCLRGEAVTFVPVAKRGDHVQWHLVHHEEGPDDCFQVIKPAQILDEEAIRSTISFLGWTPKVLNYAGEFCLNIPIVNPTIRFITRVNLRQGRRR